MTQTLKSGLVATIAFTIPATELAAATPIELVSPVDGYVSELYTVVQTAIVTGGTVTVNIGTTAVTGLSVDVASAATKGTVGSDTATLGTDTRKVLKGQRIQIVPSAAFDGGGALAGSLVIEASDTSPLAQY